MDSHFAKPKSAEKSTPWPHSLSLDERKQAALTGVREVLAFDENQVVLMTDTGELCLTGQDLHVTKLMLEEGQLTVEGRLDGIFYTQRQNKRGLFRRNGK